MSSWRADPEGVPTWDERPRCRCGFRAWLQVWSDPTPSKWGRRFFRCPDIDDDFKACTFFEWIDTSCPPPRVRLPDRLETKGQYYSRMEENREVERLARLQQERRVRQEQIRLKGKEDQLYRRRETLAAREAALKRQEEEFAAREATLRLAEERDKVRNKETMKDLPPSPPSSVSARRKGKYPRCTQ